MLEPAEINARLRMMRKQADPGRRWDQQCEGSAAALVVFVGPSPGTNPSDPAVRAPRRRNCCRALWNQSFADPLGWSPGFRISFAPLVEALFETNWSRANKLIARANLDWYGNPEASKVPEQRMLDGAPSVLRLIEDCEPQLVLPMERRAFWVLQTAMVKAGWKTAPCDVDRFSVRISRKSKRRHREIFCFRATSPDGRQLAVIKLPQHPAKMLEADYGTRCGAAVRTASIQIARRLEIDVSVDLPNNSRGN